MYANGFFEQKRRSPASLAAVVGLHAAAFGFLILYGTTTFQREDENRLKVINIKQPEPPPVEPPPRQEREAQPEQHQSRLDTPPELPPITLGPAVAGPSVPPQPPVGPVGQQRIELARVELPPPVRRAAEVDPNFRDALQPPYPRSQEVLQRGGQVRVRITIGANGRVVAIQQLTATHEDFWRATERQARNRWRFRPATVDGRPVESTMTMTVTFRIPEA